jgi:cysteine desulfurase
MIYLDHAATTPVHPEVLKQMLQWLQPDHVGNPSSIHSQGVRAHQAIEKARRQVARMINADPPEIYFTSGGTESNNAWIKNLNRHIIITTKVEHHSILEPVEKCVISAAYARPIFVKVDIAGAVDLEDLKAKLDQYHGIVGAVSVMWVNNELGTINPIKDIGTLCKTYNVPFHVDAIQAAGHVPMDVKACHIDMLSLSGHKFGAPMGTGILYIRSDIPKKPFIYGGGQECGIRGGTENVPGIVALGAAAELVVKNLSLWRDKWQSLRKIFFDSLAIHMAPDEYSINGGDNTALNIISLTVPGVNSEAMVLRLDQDDICVSAGSACSAGSPNPSHVLMGVGLPEELAASTIRISMGTDTTADEMRTAAKAIAAAAKSLKSMNTTSL